jgi:competence protein ComEA
VTGKGKITITEIFLLLGAALFLVLMLVMHLWNTRDAARGSYDVKTQKIAGEEFVIDKVDINRADVQQLQRLEGIGPVLAQRIVEYRQEVNGFTVVEELLLVEGIGEATLENIREFIIIGEMK